MRRIWFRKGSTTMVLIARFSALLAFILFLPCLSAAQAIVFGAAKNINSGLLTKSVAVGDFNRDGIADVAALNFGNGTVSILTGLGNGTFAAQTPATRFSAG